LLLSKTLLIISLSTSSTLFNFRVDPQSANIWRYVYHMLWTHCNGSQIVVRELRVTFPVGRPETQTTGLGMKEETNWWRWITIDWQISDKVQVSPCLTKYHAMKTYGGAEVKPHAFLTWTLDGGEWSVSRPGTHWTGGWVASRAGLNARTRKIPSPCRESIPGRPVRSLVTTLTKIFRLLISDKMTKIHLIGNQEVSGSKLPGGPLTVTGYERSPSMFPG
jgi:hypothetical protein